MVFEGSISICACFHSENFVIYTWSKNAWYCEVTPFQVGKQFDALLVDTSAPAFDTFESDTRNVSKANLKLVIEI